MILVEITILVEIEKAELGRIEMIFYRIVREGLKKYWGIRLRTIESKVMEEQNENLLGK